jgi:hypothetical protein
VLTTLAQTASAPATWAGVAAIAATGIFAGGFGRHLWGYLGRRQRAAEHRADLAAARAAGEQAAGEKLRAELFELVDRLQRDLDTERERYQHDAEELRRRLDGLDAELRKSRADRHKLTNDNQALTLRCALLEREVAELRARAGLPLVAPSDTLTPPGPR